MKPRSASRTALVTTTVAVSADTFHRELIRQLQTDGYDVCVVSSPGDGLGNLRRDLAVRTEEISMTREISPLADLVALSRWLRLCLRDRPSLVLAATPKASLLAMLAARLTLVPQRLYSAVGLRLEGAEGNLRLVLAAIERLTTWAATDVVANSPSLAARYQGLRLAPTSKLRVTTPASSHGVDAAHYSPRAADKGLAQELDLDLSKPVIGFVGRLTHDKGIDDLLEAMELLELRVPGMQYLVVGPQDEPDSKAFLRRLSDSAARVVTTGAVRDVRPYFSLMDVHVLPTLREGFPNVVLEASAMGVPSVTTTATGSVDSVIPGVTGLLVPSGDATALAHAIQTLALAPDTRAEFGRAAREWVSHEFQPEAVVRSLLGWSDTRSCSSTETEGAQRSCAS